MYFVTTLDFEMFVSAYLECALWSSTDESDDSGGNPLDDNYFVEDFTRNALRSARRDCRGFIGLPGVADALASVGDWGRHGHDFWLTRNGHGAGFWDRGYPAEVDKLLTDAAHSYGSEYIYVSRKRLHFGG